VNNPAAIARKVALHCEAKKHAYRQTQDGVVVSFVLHPQEVPGGLATAPLGTRYMLALAEIGDDEQPVERPAPVKPHSFAQRAGILCNEKSFWTFLNEEHFQGRPEITEEAFATNYLRAHCEVQSRKDLIEGTPAGDKFRDLAAEYDAWKRVG
jgi:hypothetical protein